MESVCEYCDHEIETTDGRGYLWSHKDTTLDQYHSPELPYDL